MNLIHFIILVCNKIPKIAERFYKYFIDTFYLHLQRLNYYANNKPLWITEWNFRIIAFANNTFTRFYNYYFIRKMLTYTSILQTMCKYTLSSPIGASNNWPVIRAAVSGHNFMPKTNHLLSILYME